MLGYEPHAAAGWLPIMIQIVFSFDCIIRSAGFEDPLGPDNDGPACGACQAWVPALTALQVDVICAIWLVGSVCLHVNYCH